MADYTAKVKVIVKSLDFVKSGGPPATIFPSSMPVLMFFGPDLSRIHTAADNTLEFVQPELLDGAAAVARALLQSPEFAEAITAR